MSGIHIIEVDFFLCFELKYAEACRLVPWKIDHQPSALRIGNGMLSLLHDLLHNGCISQVIPSS